jgi:hypothetical protein
MKTFDYCRYRPGIVQVFGLSNGYWQRAQVAHDTEVDERQMVDILSKIGSR